METFGIIVLFIVLFAVYFIPTAVAIVRKKVDVNAIFVLNIFLGWSLIGWTVALVWAIKTDA